VEAAEPPRPETPEPPAQPEAAEAPEPDPEPAEPARVAAPAPPRPRPQRVARAAEAEPEPTPEPRTQPAETPAETPAQAPSRPTATATAPERRGPPLTFSEKDGIRFAIERCWSVPVGLEAAENLSVTLGVTLSPDGKIIGGPDLIQPTGALSSSHKVAYGAARRALLRCAPYTGFPPEKYAQWRELEVTFNPKEMVIQ
jgi:outer membrane biosynthesis protein TonB